MDRFLFLLSPVFIGGLFLLLGETIHWVKNEYHSNRTDKTKVLIRTGRE